MELFKKNKSTINKIGNGQVQSGRIPSMMQGTSPLTQGRALGNTSPTLPGTNVPFRNEEQYQRFQGNSTRIPVSPQATQGPTRPGNLTSGTSTITQGTSPLLQGNTLGVNRQSQTVAPRMNLTSNPNDNSKAFGPNMGRIPVTAIAPEEMGTDSFSTQNIPSNQIASAGTNTDAIFTDTVGQRGIPLSALEPTTPTSQIPVGLIGEPAIGSPQRIPAEAPSFDSTLSIQEQIDRLERDYQTKIQNLYNEGGLRGMTAGAASALEGGLRAAALNDLTPLQQRLELLQARQEAEAEQTQQDFDNQLALREAGFSSGLEGDVTVPLSDLSIGVAQGRTSLKDLTPSDRSKVVSELTANGITVKSPEAENIKVLALQLFNSPDLKKITGLSGLAPAAKSSVKGSLITVLDQLKNIKTLGETDKMSGVLSETDIKILENAATRLQKGLSEEDMRSELSKLYKVASQIPQSFEPLIIDGLIDQEAFIGPDNLVYTLEEAQAEKRKEMLDERQSLINFNQAVPQDLGTAMRKIKAVESSGNYQARGPVVTSGQYAGERALGAYQVMSGNLPQWSREALGYQVTPQQFLQNPQIQDQIVAHQFAKNYQKYGNWDDAASVWFTGRPLARAGNAADVTGTSVQEYINRFRQA